MDVTHNPYRIHTKNLLRLNELFTQHEITGSKQLILSVIDRGFKAWQTISEEIKIMRSKVQHSYWSLCYFADFILISCFDKDTDVTLITSEWQEVNETTRVLRVMIDAPNSPKRIELQIVDERDQAYGASFTMRSIRLVDFNNTSLYEFIEKYDSLIMYDMRVFGLDYEHLTVPSTGKVITL